jgi:hypothetical protein
MRPFVLAFLAMTAGAAGALSAQAAAGPDFSGTWVLDNAKSNFAGQPAPETDTSKVSRNGNMYNIEQIGSFGSQAGGVQRMSYKWPAGDGEVTNALPQGASMHVTTKQKGDTSTFAAEVNYQGQTVMRQTGRAYLAQGGKVFIREMDLQPIQNQSPAPIHVVLVYDKK